MNKNLNAKCKSDAITIWGGAVIVGVAAFIDTTEVIAIFKIGRTLPPPTNITTYFLHLRVASLVICVLRSFSRNGVCGGTEVSMKSEEGCPLRTALAGYLLK